MKHNDNKSNIFNKNLKVTIYIPKDPVLTLHRIKNNILKDYNLRISISELFRDALTDFINSNFQQDETLKEDIKFYLESKGMI